LKFVGDATKNKYDNIFRGKCLAEE